MALGNENLLTGLQLASGRHCLVQAAGCVTTRQPVGEQATQACIAELERRAARAKELLQDEMGDWLTVEAIYMPDHYLQLKQTIDVLDGGGE